jgi:predicted DsbA family dithiol-disulfide isomerase
MGGLVRDMMDYADGSHPWKRTTADVAPHWRMVSERTGQPIDERLMIDITDPHFSTWPACIAVKAAHLQDEVVGEVYLRRLRRAALTERQLVSDQDVFAALAREVEGLDVDRLVADTRNGAGERAFQEDLTECATECARYGVTGFPTLLLAADDRGIIANGYRTFETFQMAIEQLVGPLDEHAAREVEALLDDYGPMTPQELAAVRSLSDSEALTELESLAHQGRIEQRSVRGGDFWACPPEIQT